MEAEQASAISSLFLGPKNIVFFDGSDVDVEIVNVIFVRDEVTALVDSDGNIFNYAHVVVLNNSWNL